MKSVELFTGGGGLALGTAMAGFHHLALVERDKHSCQTIRSNQQRLFALVGEWKLHQMDVRDFDFSSIDGEIDLLAGGPPCQPFSIGGKHGAFLDERDMFPHFFQALRSLRPKAFLVENVRGLLRQNFLNYFEYITLQLTHPELVAKKDESWVDHLARLERHHNSNINNEQGYCITWRLLNAADYGVPQKRERVFIVGFRSDLNVNWSFPEPSHSNEALIWHKWVTGEYWERHGIPTKERPAIPAKLNASLERNGANLLGSMSHPWKTVRDALTDLPPPDNLDAASCIPNHVYIAGARSYPGHTGSPLDEPAKTLKAGVHGVPGGENMLVLPTQEVRYFTVREAARLQTFPDEYYFSCGWGESMRQIGNAVPVTLAYIIADSIRNHLQKLTVSRKIVNAV